MNLLESIKTTLTKLDEIQDASDDEYEIPTRERFIKKTPAYDHATRAGINMFKRRYPDAKQRVMKSDSGNFVVKWLETDKLIAIIGLITNRGKLTREDMSDVYEFMDMLIDKVDSGVTVMTSPNRKSLAMIHKIKQRAEKQGISFNVEDEYIGNVMGGDPNDPELQFSQVTITKG